MRPIWLKTDKDFVLIPQEALMQTSRGNWAIVLDPSTISIDESSAFVKRYAEYCHYRQHSSHKQNDGRMSYLSYYRFKRGKIK